MTKIQMAMLDAGMTGDAGKAPLTPDGRYVVVRGRLWRAANPGLSAQAREALIGQLMDARRAVGRAKRAGNAADEAAAHATVDAAKIALGERGPPWWGDGAVDLNRHMVRTTEYADWHAALVRGDDSHGLGDGNR